MKPDWDKLMAEFKDSKDAVIADVDCTAGGKDLCEVMGVQGYPSIKHGDPNNLEDYEGGRDFESLSAFAKSNLGPQCGPGKNIDLCDAATKTQIDEFVKMSEADLNKQIAGKEAEMAKAETDLETFVKGLQESYEAATKKKDDTKAAIKASGLGLMKSVKAHRGSAKTEL